jgi:hypothetical protein
MTGDTLNPSANLMSQLRLKQHKQHAKIRDMYNKALGTKIDKTDINKDTNRDVSTKKSIVKSAAQYTKCDEVGIYGIYDAEIQQIFPFYATSDGTVQLPIACMKRDAELIIAPLQTYIGVYDGYLNDNLNSFSVKLKSTETWIYNNGDCTDAHPLHFHLTSGFVTPHSSYNSPGLLDCRRLYDPLVYSRDIYQIGPQETVAFNLTWPNYSSYDTTDSPAIQGIGGVIHCHFLQHNDSNSMIIQYFVDREGAMDCNDPKVENQMNFAFGSYSRTCNEQQ